MSSWPENYGPRLTPHEGATTPQPPKTEPMTEGQRMGQIGHLLLPVAPPPVYPDFNSTIDRASSNYRPLFKNYAEAKLAIEFMKSKYHVKDTIATDIPDTDRIREAYIRMLHNGIYDISDMKDAYGSESHRAIYKKCYSEGYLHICLWELLELICHAQRGFCHLTPWYTPDGPAYKTYGSFRERLEAVVRALRLSKAACRSLVSDQDFPARLAWHPQKELKRKLDNLQINTNKRVQKEEGIHRNEEGELVDKNNNKVPPKAKPQRKPARTRANNQTRQSRRAIRPSSRPSVAPTVAIRPAVYIPQPSLGPHDYLGAQASPGVYPPSAPQAAQHGYLPQPAQFFPQGQAPQQQYQVMQQTANHYPEQQQYQMMQPAPTHYPGMRYQTHDPMLGANPQYHVPDDETAAQNIQSQQYGYEEPARNPMNGNAMNAPNPWQEYQYGYQSQSQSQEYSYMDDPFSAQQAEF